MEDPFASLRPITEDVPVGDDVLQLKTATLVQEGKVLQAVAGLDLSNLIEPVVQVLDMSSTGGVVELTASDLLNSIRESGKQLWAAAQKVLGKQMVPALKAAAVALLDTSKNAKILDIDTREGCRDDFGAWQGCEALRARISDSLTLVQATHILRRCWRINGYGDAVKNLIPLVLDSDEEQGETTSQSQTPSTTGTQ